MAISNTTSFAVKNGLTVGTSQVINSSGNVFTGNLTITGVTSNGITFADGTRQTTAATGGSGSSSNSFSTIKISGQPDLIANTSISPLTIVAGSGITLSTVGTSNTLTIASTGGFSGGTIANQLIIANNITSTSNITGALQVSGGVGITGNLFMSGSANIVAKAVLTDDMLSIDTVGYGVTTAGLNAINVRYQGGAAAIEGTAVRVDAIPGTTAGGIWNSYRILQSTGASAGVVTNGVKFDNITPAGGTDNMIYAGTGWDSIISINGTSFINGNGVIKLINGTTSEAPIVFANANGSLLLTNAGSGSLEYDATSLYITSANTSNGAGRQIIHASQVNQLAVPVGVASAAQYFAPPQRPQLVANHTYAFKYYLSFKKITAGTVTFSFSNFPAVNFTNLNAIVTLTSQSGFGAANTLGIYANGATTTTSSASGVTLNANGGYVAIIDGVVQVASNTRLQLVITDSAGTIAANTGSLYYITDLGTNSKIGNIG